MKTHILDFWQPTLIKKFGMYIIPRRRKLFCSISVENPIPGGVPGPLHRVINNCRLSAKADYIPKRANWFGIGKREKS